MNRLWVRNLIGIAVAVAALTTICFVELSPQWSVYRRTMEPPQVLSPGASASALGQTWRLGSVRRITTLPERPFGRPIPKGATLAVVTIERSGPPVAGQCVGVLTDGRRRWKDQSSSSVDYPISPGATEFCSKPGPLQFDFLLPSNVRPTAIDITDGSDAILLRIML
jgi:hypothetical protein